MPGIRVETEREGIRQSRQAGHQPHPKNDPPSSKKCPDHRQETPFQGHAGRVRHTAGRTVAPRSLRRSIAIGALETQPSLYPDSIFIFQEPLEEMCGTVEELERQIEITVVHEVAHFIGIDDARLAELGYD